MFVSHIGGHARKKKKKKIQRVSLYSHSTRLRLIESFLKLIVIVIQHDTEKSREQEARVLCRL